MYVVDMYILLIKHLPKFTGNSEALASEFLENQEKYFPVIDKLEINHCMNFIKSATLDLEL